MRVFTFYISDDRYSVPTLSVAVATDERIARVEAARRLAESSHYLRIEVWEGDALLFALPAEQQRYPEDRSPAP